MLIQENFFRKYNRIEKFDMYINISNSQIFLVNIFVISCSILITNYMNSSIKKN